MRFKRSALRYRESGKSLADKTRLVQAAKGHRDVLPGFHDGRVLLVEYKGENLIEHEQQQKNIGERWEEKSGGKALFFWAVEKDEHVRDVHRQLQDKLAKA